MTRTGRPPTGGPADGTAALYPFLHDGAVAVDALREQVRRSTVAKAEEILGLRDRVLAGQAHRLHHCAAAMAGDFAAGATLFACGNGGSSTDAQDVVTLFLHPPLPGRPLPAIGLTNDIAEVTALANDIGFDVVFSRQVAAFGRAGDILVGLSTSGNSANVLRAFDEAARLGMRTVGLAGGDGGAMAASEAIDHLFVVPSSSVHRIQETQTTLYHVLWELVQQLLLPDPEEERHVPGHPG